MINLILRGTKYHPYPGGVLLHLWAGRDYILHLWALHLSDITYAAVSMSLITLCYIPQY